MTKEKHIGIIKKQLVEAGIEVKDGMIRTSELDYAITVILADAEIIPFPSKPQPKKTKLAYDFDKILSAIKSKCSSLPVVESITGGPSAVTSGMYDILINIKNDKKWGSYGFVIRCSYDADKKSMSTLLYHSGGSNKFYPSGLHEYSMRLNKKFPADDKSIEAFGRSVLRAITEVAIDRKYKHFSNKPKENKYDDY